MSSTIEVKVPHAERGRCAQLLLDALDGHAGVLGVEFAPTDGNLTVRYDPRRIEAATVQDVARDLGLSLETELHRCQWALKGVRCHDCSMALERSVAKVPGVRWVEANSAGATLAVEMESGREVAAAVEQRVRSFGYQVTDPGEAAEDANWLVHPMTLGALACGALALSGGIAMVMRAPEWLRLSLFAAAYVAGGFQGLIEAWAALKTGVFDVNFLMLLSAGGAAVIGHWPEGATLLFLFSLSNALQFFALERTRHAIRALMKLKPERAAVLREGREVEVPAAQLRPGDLVRLRPGERFAADGTVVEGETHCDESTMTGESVPVGKREGEPVYTGTVNLEGAITMRVDRAANETRLARIIRMVEKAQGEKAPTQRFIDQFGQVYAVFVLGVVALMMLLLPSVLHMPFQQALYRSMVALVVASPCALVISTPASVLSGIAAGARRGILFKGGGHLEAVGRVRAVALDKTGTLTQGHPVLTEAEPAPGRDREDLLRCAGAVESRSEHPLARALLASLAGMQLPEASGVKSHAGRGVEATVEGRRILAGSERFLTEQGIPLPAGLLQQMQALESEGRTVVLVADAAALGLFAVADEPRPEAAAAISEMRREGVERMLMITGDHTVVAHAIARRLGIQDVRAGLLPEDKVEAVRELRRKYGVVAMVGDGVNDAPALAAADVGVAMGGGGTDVAMETADVVLMSESLSRLPSMVRLGRRTAGIVRQNVWISVSVMAVLVILNLFGKITLPLGVVGHEGSTLVVVLNGLRLLRGDR